MWGTMREILGAGPQLADAVQYARADRTGSVPETAVTTREEANAILGGPIASTRLNWWETAIRSTSVCSRRRAFPTAISY